MGSARRWILLLDPHIRLWLFDDSEKLRCKTFTMLRDEATPLSLWPISLGALAQNQKERMQIHGDVRSWVNRARAGAKEAALTHEIAAAALDLPLHKDSAEGMIAATALVIGLRLVPADECLLQLEKIQTLPNSEDSNSTRL